MIPDLVIVLILVPVSIILATAARVFLLRDYKKPRLTPTHTPKDPPTYLDCHDLATKLADRRRDYSLYVDGEFVSVSKDDWIWHRTHQLLGDPSDYHSANKEPSYRTMQGIPLPPKGTGGVVTQGMRSLTHEENERRLESKVDDIVQDESEFDRTLAQAHAYLQHHGIYSYTLGDYEEVHSWGAGLRYRTNTPSPMTFEESENLLRLLRRGPTP